MVRRIFTVFRVGQNSIFFNLNIIFGTKYNWNDVSTEHLLATNADWLTPYLANIKKPEDLKKIDLKTVLQHHLDFDLQKRLEKLAPEKINVPSGSNIKLM